jgi:muramoyltetrapeptide carboxypeptidase
MIKPKVLSPGDTIAIIAPSGGLAKIFPHRLDNAIKFLESQGYHIKEFPTCRKNNGWESAPAKERAEDIMSAFKDPKVKAIICEIGGTVSNQTLNHLDFELIKNNPKIFCGYSDISILHYALNTKSNLTTFYGPCAMTQFGEYPKPLAYTLDYFNKAVADVNPIGKITASNEWTEELLNWGKKKDLERPRNLKPNLGFEWLRKGKAKGKIIGGCLTSIVNLTGTRFWPKYKDKILFLEIPEGQEFGKGEALSYVDMYLENLNLVGTFSEIKGLIFGRPFLYSEEETKLLKEKLIERTKNYNFPILFGVDIGHSDPQITIPLGVEVELDSENNLFQIIEPGVSN